jgi:hypothetical protein
MTVFMFSLSAMGQVARGPYPLGENRNMKNAIVCEKEAIKNGHNATEKAIEKATYRLNEKIDGVISATGGSQSDGHEYRLNTIYITRPGSSFIGQKIDLPVTISGHTITVLEESVMVCATVTSSR